MRDEKMNEQTISDPVYTLHKRYCALYIGLQRSKVCPPRELIWLTRTSSHSLVPDTDVVGWLHSLWLSPLLIWQCCTLIPRASCSAVHQDGFLGRGVRFPLVQTTYYTPMMLSLSLLPIRNFLPNFKRKSPPAALRRVIRAAARQERALEAPLALGRNQRQREIESMQSGIRWDRYLIYDSSSYMLCSARRQPLLR